MIAEAKSPAHTERVIERVEQPALRAVCQRRPAQRLQRRSGWVSWFRFTSSIRGSRFECKLDAGKYERCRPPKCYDDLRPGRHIFRVYAIGPEGTIDESPAKVRSKVRRT